MHVTYIVSVCNNTHHTSTNPRLHSFIYTHTYIHKHMHILIILECSTKKSSRCIGDVLHFSTTCQSTRKHWPSESYQSRAHLLPKIPSDLHSRHTHTSSVHSSTTQSRNHILTGQAQWWSCEWDRGVSSSPPTGGRSQVGPRRGKQHGRCEPLQQQ